jgi:hypothetical protein
MKRSWREERGLCGLGEGGGAQLCCSVQRSPCESYLDRKLFEQETGTALKLCGEKNRFRLTVNRLTLFFKQGPQFERDTGDGLSGYKKIKKKKKTDK